MELNSLRHKNARLTVGEFLQLRITDLTRNGVFRTPLGALCTAKWADCGGKTIGFGRITLQIAHGIPYLKLAFSYPVLPYGVEDPWKAIILLVSTKCHFGGFRHWFRCPCETGGTRCDRRVGVLYWQPEVHNWGCRRCFNLTYTSCQTHDNRVGMLLRAAPSELTRMLSKGSIRQQLLAIRTVTAMYERLGRRRGKRPYYAHFGNS